MADGKWIEGLTPEMPVAEAATAVLAARLEVVRHYLPLAAEKPYDDPEYVHQLRVGTRRAGAALRVFADCLPRKHRRMARRRLREIRRAAGDARDWDVFLLGLRRIAVAGHCRRAARSRLPHRLRDGRAHRGAGTARLHRRPRPAHRSWRRALHFPASPTQPDGKNVPANFGELAHRSVRRTPGGVQRGSSRRIRATPPLCTGSASAASAFGTHSRSSPAAFPPGSRTRSTPRSNSFRRCSAIQDSTVGTEHLLGLRQRIEKSLPREWPRLRKGFDAQLKALRARVPAGRKAFQKWRKDWAKLIRDFKLEAAVATVTVP